MAPKNSVDGVEDEGFFFALENFIEYLKNANKGFILFWVVIITLVIYTISKAWGKFAWLFG